MAQLTKDCWVGSPVCNNRPLLLYLKSYFIEFSGRNQVLHEGLDGVLDDGSQTARPMLESEDPVDEDVGKDAVDDERPRKKQRSAGIKRHSAHFQPSPPCVDGDSSL